VIARIGAGFPGSCTAHDVRCAGTPASYNTDWIPQVNHDGVSELWIRAIQSLANAMVGTAASLVDGTAAISMHEL